MDYFNEIEMIREKYLTYKIGSSSDFLPLIFGLALGLHRKNQARVG